MSDKLRTLSCSPAVVGRPELMRTQNCESGESAECKLVLAQSSDDLLFDIHDMQTVLYFSVPFPVDIGPINGTVCNKSFPAAECRRKAMNNGAFVPVSECRADFVDGLMYRFTYTLNPIAIEDDQQPSIDVSGVPQNIDLFRTLWLDRNNVLAVTNGQAELLNQIAIGTAAKERNPFSGQ